MGPSQLVETALSVDHLFPVEVVVGVQVSAKEPTLYFVTWHWPPRRSMHSLFKGICFFSQAAGGPCAEGGSAYDQSFEPPDWVRREAEKDVCMFQYRPTRYGSGMPVA